METNVNLSNDQWYLYFDKWGSQEESIKQVVRDNKLLRIQGGFPNKNQIWGQV